MASNGDMLLSSPDPLAWSNENVPTPSSTKARGPTVTPRKALIDASGNARVQDFYISTPPARRTSGSPTKSPKHAASTSPWRIRLTVQAEQFDDVPKSMSSKNTPSKRHTERTTTITVPLKGGDDTPPLVAKKGRGRPRKSLDSPKKRSGTPKPKTSGSRKTMPESLEDEGDSAAIAIDLPPKKARGRPRKSMETREGSQITGAEPSPHTELVREVEPAVTGARTTRPRSKGRRKEITPMKILLNSDFDDIENSTEVHQSLPKETEWTLNGGAEDRPNGVSSSEPRLPASGRTVIEMSHEQSVLEQQDEDLWRDMIRSGSPSPCVRHENEVDQADLDPTDVHQEYDTILESEGFSMVSVSSLASTGNRLNSPDPQVYGGSVRELTPAIASSPSVPPMLQDHQLQPSPRHLVKPQDGTPKLTRVVRAGTALQGLLSPDEQRLDLSLVKSKTQSSPFIVEKEANKEDHAFPTSKVSLQRRPLDNAFGGFGAGTRRELRAGLRLGEELAKKQRELSQDLVCDSRPDEDVFRAAVKPQYPQLPGLDAQKSHNTKVPYPKESKEEVEYPSLSRTQLPTPERSEADADEGLMDWKADTPVKLDRKVSTIARDALNDTEEGPEAATVDYTMMAREAEWRREREAISNQIEMASRSQVIVIDSDDEEIVDEQAYEEDEDYDGLKDDSDIWQAEAHSADHSREPTPEASDVSLQPEAIKPRRSKLPSSWRRDSLLTYHSEVEATESDLFWQPDHVQAKASTKLNGREKELHDQTQNSSQPDDSTGALIARQLSPEKAFHHAKTSPRLSSPLTMAEENLVPTDSGLRLGNLISTQSDGEMVPVTPESEYGATSSDLLEGKTHMSLVVTGSVRDSSISLVKSTVKDATPIDPMLLQKPGAKQKQRQRQRQNPRPPITVQPAIETETSWLSRLTAPIWSLITPITQLPPPATKEDILCSSPYEPLCQLTPWEDCHLRALGPLYYSSLLYGSHIFPFNRRSPSAVYCGAKVSTPLGWSRYITKTDCSVSDAFMVLLEERGFALGESSERWIDVGLVVRMCVSLWVGMVMRGEVEVDAAKGERVGLRREGNRIWTKEDIRWEECESEYFERKRREFDGLPSWKALGLKMDRSTNCWTMV